MNLSKSQSIFLYIFVFTTGAAVMAIEIAASRLLAPFFGNSMFVWAVIITIIMVGLALGYWWGGKFADKHPNFRGLFTTSLLAGIFTALIPVFGQLIFSIYEKNVVNNPLESLGTIGSTFLLSVVLFLPAVILFGFISPYATRIAVDKVAHTGNIAGKIYAFSTFGSIIGVLLTSFVFIPFIGTRETILIFSALIIFISSLGLGKWQYFIILLLPILVYIFTEGNIKNTENLLFEKDTPYQYVQVVGNNTERYLVFDEGGWAQSHYNFQTKLSDDYYDYYVYLPDLIGKKTQNIAVIGLAGGVVAKEIQNYQKNNYNIDIDGVEIDPVVADIAKEYFGLTENEANIIVDDGRNFLRHSDKKYDAIFIDAYTRQFHIPFHLSTLEFFTLANNRLNDGGIVTMNVNAGSDSAPILQSITKTLGTVFSNVYVNHVGKLNYLIFASESEIDFSKISRHENFPSKLLTDRNTLINGMKKNNPSGNAGIILTDNKSPIEYLTESQFLSFAKKK